MILKGKTALVTGASGGIGESLARKLAERGANLILTARRVDRLEKLASELSQRHQIQARSIPLDLAAAEAGQQLFAQTEGQGQRVDVLINNAAFGHHTFFLDLPIEDTMKQLQLNVLVLTDLTWRFARAMRDRRSGAVLNISSTSAYTPAPTFATYGAGKAYVLNFTEALSYELRGYGVVVTCVCPGLTRTEFQQTAGHEVPSAFAWTYMSADRCAEIALSALEKHKRNVIPGVVNKISMALLGMLPRTWTIPIVRGLTGAPALPSGAEPKDGGAR